MKTYIENPRFFALFAASVSLATLLGALGFQFLGGLSPCKMCIWQRWPHGIIAALMIVVFVLLPQRKVIIAFVLAGITALIGAGIGVYHAGVELKYWQGPQTCTAPSIADLSATDLLAQLQNTPVTRCDEIAWQFMGLSMAGWNAVISVGIALLCFWGAKATYGSNSTSQ